MIIFSAPSHACLIPKWLDKVNRADIATGPVDGTRIESYFEPALAGDPSLFYFISELRIGQWNREVSGWIKFVK